MDDEIDYKKSYEQMTDLEKHHRVKLAHQDRVIAALKTNLNLMRKERRERVDNNKLKMKEVGIEPRE